jgi:uncharacterized repeat protein (TIGR03803 family)
MKPKPGKTTECRRGRVRADSVSDPATNLKGRLLACWMLLLLSGLPVNAQFVYEPLKEFGSGDLSGFLPYAGLIEGSDGALYGTTSSGGTRTNGTVFKISQERDDYFVLRSFTNSLTDGRFPVGGVIEASDGVLYGTTHHGGNPGAGFNLDGQGTVFKLNRDGSGYAVLRKFYASADDGYHPWGHVVEGSDGRLYGATAGGGGSSSFAGTVFRLNKDGGDYVVLHRFSADSHGGVLPRCALLEGSDGALYGTTERGGSHGIGSIFKLGKDGSNYVVLHNFGSGVGDGANPFAALLEGSDGFLYGVTSAGGTTNAGAVFKLSRDGSGYQVLRRFGASPTDARNAYSALIEGSDGALYGTTRNGGAMDQGAIFTLGRNGSNYRVLHSFGTVTNDGRGPLSKLIESRDGWFYGVTYVGGATRRGVVFRFRFSVRTTLTMTPEGPRLDFSGAPGRTYDVQRALMIDGPWDTIATRVAPANGFIEYIDRAQPQPNAFYRVRSRSAL